MIPAGFEERYIEADGFRIRYVEAGAGEALVCLHGAGGLRISKALELLAEKYRIIAFEAPGFGASAANERSTSVADLARSMNLAVAALGVQRFSLWGNSFGARVALNMALQARSQISSVILVAPAAIRVTPRSFVGEPTSEMLYAHPERMAAAEPPGADVLEKQRALLKRLASPPRDPELEEKLKTLDVPMLVLFGTLDAVIPTENARVYKDLMPKCNIVMVYDAAHAIDADRPEAVAEVVGDYLERQDSFLVTRASGLIHR